MIILKKCYRVLPILAAFFCYTLNGLAQENIIPRPVSMKVTDTFRFPIKAHGIIGVDAPSHAAGIYLQRYISRYYGVPLEVKEYKAIPASVGIRLHMKYQDNVEGYTLKIDGKGIDMGAGNGGMFYGIQTLLQCLSQDADSVLRAGSVEITDWPRFRWRGLSLDVCRHFFTVDEVKAYIDIMSHYKLNVLHWHLTDDEGWRIQIDKYPKLTEVGSRMGYYEARGEFRKLDNLVFPVRDGYYTKDDIREVLQYATERHVTILPEIEMPSHSEAAIFAYPELGCQDSTGAKHRVTLLDPSEHTFAFLTDVLSEVMALFPNQYIHIGGDEANMKAWLKSPAAVALMKKEHMQDVKEVQSYFIKRIEKVVLAHNKKLVGWDEILQGGLAASATVMSWQGEAGGIAAAKMHHPVVMTPLPQMYFDAPQGNEATEPVGWNPPVPWQMVYNYDPVPAALNSTEASYILGVQGNIWTEKIPSNGHLQYMIYPRAIAMAEVAWTPRDAKNMDDFRRRLYGNQYNLLKRWGVNARLPAVEGVSDVATNLDVYHVTLNHPLAAATVRYTLDGTLPDTAATGQPFPVEITTPLKDTLTLTTATSWTYNHQRVLQRAFIHRVEVQPSVTPALQPGLDFKRYTTDEEEEGKLDALQPDSAGVVAAPLRFVRAWNEDNRWVKMTGYLQIDTEGDYTLASELESSPTVSLGNVEIISGGRDAYATPQQALLHLKKGCYALQLVYRFVNDREKGKVLTVTDASAAGRKVAARYFH